MTPTDIFTLNIEEGKITIQTSPEMAKDLIYVLSTLLDLSKAIRTQVIHARAIAAASDHEDVNRRRYQFQKQSMMIYTRYLEHMNNGCYKNKATAIQMIKKDFNIGYGEAKIFITEGRRLERERKRSSCQIVSTKGRTVTQDRLS